MEVNHISNTNFNGAFRILGENICPPYLLKRLNENSFVNAFRNNNKKTLEIIVKHREASRWEVIRQRRDDDLYKIMFRSSYPEDTWVGRLKNFFLSRTMRLTKDFDYHSEGTNIEWLSSKSNMKRIFDKLA